MFTIFTMEITYYDHFLFLAQFFVATNAAPKIYIGRFLVRLFSKDISIENFMVCSFKPASYDSP